MTLSEAVINEVVITECHREAFGLEGIRCNSILFRPEQ
jgi:hypothetical protein